MLLLLLSNFLLVPSRRKVVPAFDSFDSPRGCKMSLLFGTVSFVIAFHFCWFNKTIPQSNRSCVRRDSGSLFFTVFRFERLIILFNNRLKNSQVPVNKKHN